MADETSEEPHGAFYRDRSKDFVNLHEQVTASVDLLDSLESFLAKFQSDLAAVSGQISDLQGRSKEFDARLHGRKKIEKPLSQLVSDLSISPSLVSAILDTPVGETWISAISELEQKISSVKARSRVKGARDIAEVVEGLRIGAATKIRSYFLSMLQPIRTNISTNMHVLQTSVFLKNLPLYHFLQRHAKQTAQEIQRAYIVSARLYYETGFRRYTRSLGYIKARIVERSVLIGSSSADAAVPEDFIDSERFASARLDGPNVTLAYMADDKNYKEPMEGLFRSMMMVLMDNATAEYSFICRFFEEPVDVVLPESGARTPLMSPTASSFSMDHRLTSGTSERITESRRTSVIEISAPSMTKEEEKEQKAVYESIWKQIFDSPIQYCQDFAKTIMEPPPPVIPLLTMIRINEAVFDEVQRRGCSPLETFIIGQRLTMWPIFQKEMSAHVESLKRLSDGASGGYLTRGVTLKDSLIQKIVQRYSALFSAFVVLSSDADEAMLFSSLVRLRQELSRMISTQASKLKDPKQSAAYLTTTYEILLHNLSNGSHPSTHPKAQAETAHWREIEEGARRRIALTRH